MLREAGIVSLLSACLSVCPSVCSVCVCVSVGANIKTRSLAIAKRLCNCFVGQFWPNVTGIRYFIYTSFIHQRTGSKKIKKKTQETGSNKLDWHAFYPTFTAQPGLKVIKKFNVDSITQLTYSFNISSILLENVM